MKNLMLTILLVLGISITAMAQITPPTPLTINQNANLVATIEGLFTGCVEVDSIEFIGNPLAYGSFANGTEAIGLESGFVMSTGKVITGMGTNYPGSSWPFWMPGNALYNQTFGSNSSTDAQILKFIVIPHNHLLTLHYVFASEGYGVNLSSNEGVGIFVSGPEPGNVTQYENKNIAVVPWNGDPVTVANVGPGTGPNSNLYVSNPFGGPGHTYDGYTVPMIAEIDVVPCETYHFTVMLADIEGGQGFDSAVFLDAEGISSDFDLDLVSISLAGGEFDIYEGCTNQLVVQRINPDTLELQQPFDFTIELGGDATDSIDFVGITDSTYTIPGGSYFMTLDYTAVLDSIIEGVETIVFNISHVSLCDSTCEGMYSMEIEVIDNFELEAGISMNDTNICAYQTSFMLLETFIPPDMDPNLVTYSWSNNSTASSINIAPPLDESTLYVCTITDVCGQTAIDSVRITNSSFSAISIGTVDNLCYGDHEGSATVLTQNGFEPFTYEWDPIALGVTNEGFLDSLPSDYYSVTVYDSIGCNHSGTFFINQPDSIFTSLTRHNPLCYLDANGSIEFQTFNGVPPFTYEWSTGDTTMNLDSIPEGIYSITATDANGCEVMSTDTLDDPNLLTMWSSPDQYVCKDQTITLNAIAYGGTPTYFFVWEHGASGSQVQITPQETATYIVHVEDLNGCTTESQSITVNVYPDISVELTTLHDSICEGEQTIIYAEILGGTGGPYETIWFDGASSDLIPPPYTVSPNQTTEYEIWAKDECGSPTGNYTMTIEVFEAPEIEILSDFFEGCAPMTVTFIDTIPDDGYIYDWAANETHPDNGKTYDWDFGDGVYDILHNRRKPTHKYEKEGVYDVSLTVTSKVGCSSKATASQMIKIFPNPIARFYPDPLEASIIKPIIFFDNVSTGAYSSTWDFGDSTEVSYATTPEHYYTEPGEYEITLNVATEHGCKDDFSQNIVIKNEYTFYAPNVFNPNSDIPENRNFMPIGLGIDNDHFHLIIYDRLGAKVYETFDIYRPWNGEANGKKVVEGETYPWIVIYKDLTGQEHRENGTVTIIK